MGFAREYHRSVEGYRAIAASEAEAAPAASREPAPGKQTLVARWLAQLEGMAWWTEAAAAPADPGRRTALDGATPPALGFDDYRVLALRDVLGELGARPALRDEAHAAAAGADRTVAGRATLWHTRPAGSPTPSGHALWQAAERRAVTLYRRAVGEGAVDLADPALAAALARCGAGQPVPGALCREMERELGVELSGVRIHTDAVAAQAARAVCAEAFTVGEDIFFAEHAFAPETRAGHRLLAHELTHVAQALRGDAGPDHGGLRVSRPDEPREREAEAVADRLDEAVSEPRARDEEAAIGGPGDAASGQRAREVETAPRVSVLLGSRKRR